MQNIWEQSLFCLLMSMQMAFYLVNMSLVMQVNPCFQPPSTSMMPSVTSYIARSRPDSPHLCLHVSTKKTRSGKNIPKGINGKPVPIYLGDVTPLRIRVEIKFRVNVTVLLSPHFTFTYMCKNLEYNSCLLIQLEYYCGMHFFVFLSRLASCYMYVIKPYVADRPLGLPV